MHSTWSPATRPTAGRSPGRSAPTAGHAPEALLTGSSSTYHALRCGLALADRLDAPQPEWEIATGRLGHVIVEHPEAFLDKSRFSMDWYYPVLGGAVRGAAGARAARRAGWDAFVVPGLGIRCVDDEPWVTGAETAELRHRARCGRDDATARLRCSPTMQHLRTPDGSYWTGWQFANEVNWPAEQSTWTAAAVVLAADALSRTTPGNAVFSADRPPGRAWPRRGGLRLRVDRRGRGAASRLSLRSRASGSAEDAQAADLADLDEAVGRARR